MDIEKYLVNKKKLIDEALDNYLPRASEYPQVIHEAMRYAVFSGGKRIRAILTLAAGEAVEGKEEELLLPAAALELIHAYSLVHDDLPAIDDDDFRRGKPSCHKKFNEAIAILAGDALLTHSFYLLSKIKNSPARVIKVYEEISKAIGTSGMIGGQVVDIKSEDSEILDVPTLEYIHTHKTGALLCATVKVGCILGRGDKNQLLFLTRYGEHIGLAFQIVDDLLDLEEGIKGRDRKSDLVKKKLTYPAVYGIESSKKQVTMLIESAISCLKNFNHKADPLRAIAEFIGRRGSVIQTVDYRHQTKAGRNCRRISKRSGHYKISNTRCSSFLKV
ncbi:MAG: polyprenyl synthetase family protein [bacterium]